MTAGVVSNYIGLLKRAISDAQKSFDKHPVPVSERKEAYEALSHLLLAYSLLRRLGGNYTRVRVEHPISVGEKWRAKIGKSKLKPDIEVGDNYNSVNLLIQVAPVWWWREHSRKWLLRKVKSDTRKLLAIRDSPDWEDKSRLECVVVVPVYQRPRHDYFEYEEVKEARKYCNRKDVHLFFLRMHPP